MSDDWEDFKKSIYEFSIERRYDIKREIEDLEQELKKINENIEKYESGEWDEL